MTDKKTERLARFICECDNIVFFGGAGVSTESGIPDFRSADGLYNRRDVRFDGYEPEYLLSHECLVNEPRVFFEFYRQKLDCRNVKPNAAHYALAELEKLGKLRAVITQNIDGLHQAAGSKKVFEIHGTTAENYCMRCGRKYPADHIFRCGEDIPHCECGGVIRCDVTLYGEQLPEKAVKGTVDAISHADMLIIGGTSLSVYPAASYVTYFRGKYLAVINRDHLPLRFSVDRSVQINAPIGEVLSETMDAVRRYLAE